MPIACNCYAKVISMLAKEIDWNHIDWNDEEDVTCPVDA